MNAHRTLSLLMLAAGLLAHAELQAVNTVFSGYFRGDEPRTHALDDGCQTAAPESQAYHVSGPLQVDRAGRYTVVSAYQYMPETHGVALYRGDFDPAAPLQQLVDRTSMAGFAVFDEPLSMRVRLEPGVIYRFVVSTFCGAAANSAQGVVPAQWAVTFSGPGEVFGGGGDRVTDLPAFFQGSIPTDTSPHYLGCGNGDFLQLGPQTMTRGSYYFVDVSQYFSNNICLEIHSAPLDPADPEATLILRATEWGGTFELPPGDYYPVVRIENAMYAIPGGEYFFLLVSSAQTAPVIQASLAGSWYDPATPGQGFFIEVLDSVRTMFLGWFTFDIEGQAPLVSSVIGGVNQRWLTAQGPYEGSQASLEITATTGGVFGSPLPAPAQLPVGMMNVHFEDCNRGWIDYDLVATGFSDRIPIQRLGAASAVSCTSQMLGPDRPGPLY